MRDLMRGIPIRDHGVTTVDLSGQDRTKNTVASHRYHAALMGIRWVSTSESRVANEPSVLAIAETIAAMGVSVWIAVTWHTYIHIAIGALLAPLLLTRTDTGCVRAAALGYRFIRLSDIPGAFFNSIRTPPLLHVIIAVLLYVPWFCVSFIAARIIAAIIELAQSPGAALQATPTNWREATITLDCAAVPEIMHRPRSDLVQEFEGMGVCVNIGTLMSRCRTSVKQEWPSIIRTAYLVLAWALISAMGLVAYAYRWSIKSTAIIWFPLLWALRSVRLAGIGLKSYLSMYVRDPFNKIVLALSILSVVLFVTKVVLLGKWDGFVEWINSLWPMDILSLYIAPAEVPKWQVAMAINSAIAILMYLLAAHWLVWLRHKDLKAEAGKRLVFRAGLFVRPFLSCYTIACTLYITIRAAWNFNWPPLGEQWFPWQ